MYRALLFLSLLGTGATAAPPALMPLPAVLTPAQGALSIGPSFSVALSGAADARLPAAIGRFLSRLARQTGIPMPAAKTAAAGGETPAPAARSTAEATAPEPHRRAGPRTAAAPVNCTALP